MAIPRRKADLPVATAIATSLSREIGSLLLRLPHVTQVFVRRESDICYVWTVVDDFSEEVRDVVHRTEQELIEAFRPAKFSFRVVPRGAVAPIDEAECFAKPS